MIAKKIVAVEKKIRKIKAELQLIEEMRPGSLTLQYKDPKEKKGAYYQISYTHEMRSRTEYIRPQFVKEVKQQIKDYKRFKKLNENWVKLSIELSRLKMKLDIQKEKSDRKEL